MSRKYKVIIVEDEQLARDRLRKLLLPFADQLDIIGEATDGSEGLALAEALRPDLVFLDIQMPVMNGFEMLQQLTYEPRIIFTTAFDQYAIKAFEENSVDYLLKPIEEQRLQRSIQKLESLQSSDSNDQLTMLIQKLGSEELKTITVTIGDRMLLVPVEDILYFHAEDKYVFIHDKAGKKHLISTSLSDLEKKLGNSFLRVHRAYIINRNHVQEIRKALNSKLTFYMKGTESAKITSSHSYTPAIRKLFQL